MNKKRRIRNKRMGVNDAFFSDVMRRLMQRDGTLSGIEEAA